jgi:transcriptional regulator of acetoin/glycerol metabolism
MKDCYAQISRNQQMPLNSRTLSISHSEHHFVQSIFIHYVYSCSIIPLWDPSLPLIAIYRIYSSVPFERRERQSFHQVTVRKSLARLVGGITYFTACINKNVTGIMITFKFLPSTKNSSMCLMPRFFRRETVTVFHTFRSKRF